MAGTAGSARAGISTPLVLAGFVFTAACAPGPGRQADPPATDGDPLTALLAATGADRMIDLSYPFDARTVYWPTASRFQLTVEAEGVAEGGWWYALNSIRASEHGGTHMDAPYHFARDGWTVDAVPLPSLVAPAVVLDVREACAADPDHAVTEEEIREFEGEHGAIPAGAVVVLHTGWGERWPDLKTYLGDDRPDVTDDLHFPGFSAGAARYLAGKGIAGAGIDTASLDPGPSRDFAAHRIFGEANIYGLENLDNVERLPATGATLVALPMKIGRGTGGPVRVVAFLP